MSPSPRLDEIPLSPLARALTQSLLRLYPDPDPWVLCAVALTVEGLANGDVCLPLANLAGQRPWPELPHRLPALADWLPRLASSALIGRPGQYRPLILERERLYLARYQAYEQTLAADFLQRATSQPAVDEGRLTDSLTRLFPGQPAQLDWQRIAVAQAVRRRLLVISGGPGTGKTTTVVRLLAALLEQPETADLRIGLAAPTGKAAARLAESLHAAKARLPVSDAIKARLPERAQTLHRLLGARADSPQVRQRAGQPLALDLLVVDEASMVDLALMAKLTEALPAQARLILLGDKEQLSAVEAGAVFAEVCAGRGLSQAEAKTLSRISQQAVPAEPPTSALGESVILLSHSHRFASNSGIGELAQQVRQGDRTAVLALLENPPQGLAWHPTPHPGTLLTRLEQAYQAYLETAQQGAPAAAFTAFSAFRALAALREGPWGVEALSSALEARIKRRLGIPERQAWYAGRAVMVRQNDYALGLFNGDVGLCLQGSKGLRLYFQSDAGLRDFAPARLPSHDSAFLLTVHQSQGSEFDEVLMILPEQDHALLDRALLYTGITRARQRVELWAPAEALLGALNRRRQRASGLADRLARAAPASTGSKQQLSLF